MLPYYLVAVAQTADGIKLGPRYDRFDDALRSAGSMLEDGALAAWIIDRDGSLLLPAEQVKRHFESAERTRRTATNDRSRRDEEVLFRGESAG